MYPSRHIIPSLFCAIPDVCLLFVGSTTKEIHCLIVILGDHDLIITVNSFTVNYTENI